MKVPLPPSHDLKLSREGYVRTVRTSTAPDGPTWDQTTADVSHLQSNIRHLLEPERDPADKTLWTPPVPTFTYLAGAAGCGKTFAVKEWAEREKGLLLVATTGIAAINLGGTTINSLLGYFDTASLQEIYTNGFLTAKLGKLWKAGGRRILLDECSMLDGDQLTYLVKAIEEVNGRGYVLEKTDPDADLSSDGSGGLGLTVVGDFCQLPPVKAPFAFDSTEWDRFTDHTITLTEIRRQAEPGFIQALRQCRRGEGHLALEVFGPTLQRVTDDQFDGPTLLAKNEAVDRYNWIRMNRLQGPEHKEILFTNERWGKQRSEWGSTTKPPHTWGIPPRLQLKVGCLVMILANERLIDSRDFLYVNGDLGTVVDGSPDGHTCEVKLHRTGEVVDVHYVRREVLTPMDSARRKQLRAEKKDDLISENGRYEIEGWVDYLPLRVAYASTVHKSQGLSLDQVQVNLADPFFKTPGMVYVALSRARTAAGLRLVGTAAAFVERCVTDPRLNRWL